MLGLEQCYQSPIGVVATVPENAIVGTGNPTVQKCV